MLRRRVAAMLGVVGAGASFASSARAEDLFEIQVFHSVIVRPEHFDLELHSNYAGAGPRSLSSGETSTQGVLYEMVEPSFGIAPGWEVAAHIQQAFRPDGTLVWGGERARIMGVFTGEDPRARWHLGLNLEGGYLPARFDPAGWEIEARPVIEWNGAGVDVDVNPVVAMPLGSSDAGKPELRPSIAVRLQLSDLVQPSVEYYGDFGPVSRPPPVAWQRHYVFETVDVFCWREWIVRFGVGEGLTSASTRFIVTSLFGHHF